MQSVLLVDDDIKNEPDVVVLDISLPAGDGFLVAERLQKLVGSLAWRPSVSAV
jgi:CheY-like chemotaxis protein